MMSRFLLAASLSSAAALDCPTVKSFYQTVTTADGAGCCEHGTSSIDSASCLTEYAKMDEVYTPFDAYPTEDVYVRYAKKDAKAVIEAGNRPIICEACSLKVGVMLSVYERDRTGESDQVEYMWGKYSYDEATNTCVPPSSMTTVKLGDVTGTPTWESQPAQWDPSDRQEFVLSLKSQYTATQHGEIAGKEYYATCDLSTPSNTTEFIECCNGAVKTQLDIMDETGNNRRSVSAARITNGCAPPGSKIQTLPGSDLDTLLNTPGVTAVMDFSETMAISTVHAIDPAGVWTGVHGVRTITRTNGKDLVNGFTRWSIEGELYESNGDFPVAFIGAGVPNDEQHGKLVFTAGNTTLVVDKLSINYATADFSTGSCKGTCVAYGEHTFVIGALNNILPASTMRVKSSFNGPLRTSKGFIDILGKHTYGVDDATPTGSNLTAIKEALNFQFYIGGKDFAPLDPANVRIDEISGTYVIKVSSCPTPLRTPLPIAESTLAPFVSKGKKAKTAMGGDVVIGCIESNRMLVVGEADSYKMSGGLILDPALHNGKYMLHGMVIAKTSTELDEGRDLGYQTKFNQLTEAFWYSGQIADIVGNKIMPVFSATTSKPLFAMMNNLVNGVANDATNMPEVLIPKNFNMAPANKNGMLMTILKPVEVIGGIDAVPAMTAWEPWPNTDPLSTSRKYTGVTLRAIPGTAQWFASSNPTIMGEGVEFADLSVLGKLNGSPLPSACADHQLDIQLGRSYPMCKSSDADEIETCIATWCECMTEIYPQTVGKSVLVKRGAITFVEKAWALSKTFGGVWNYIVSDSQGPSYYQSGIGGWLESSWDMYIDKIDPRCPSISMVNGDDMLNPGYGYVTKLKLVSQEYFDRLAATMTIVKKPDGIVSGSLEYSDWLDEWNTDAMYHVLNPSFYPLIDKTGKAIVVSTGAGEFTSFKAHCLKSTTTYLSSTDFTVKESSPPAEDVTQTFVLAHDSSVPDAPTYELPKCADATDYLILEMCPYLDGTKDGNFRFDDTAVYLSEWCLANLRFMQVKLGNDRTATLNPVADGYFYTAPKYLP